MSSRAKSRDPVACRATNHGVLRLRLRSAQDDTRPVFTRSSRIPRMRFCTLELERKASTVFCIRRLQLDFAAVHGTLNRSLRARRSVIITMAIQALLWNNALIIAG